MRELIEKLRAAKEGSRELDAEIAYGLLTERERERMLRRGIRLGRIAHYTTSLDDAVTLFPILPNYISSNPIEVCIEALEARLVTCTQETPDDR